MLTVIMLARDEERHLARAIASLEGLARRVIVVDSGSSDRTVEIARRSGADVLSHPFINYAKQFNWALAQLPANDNWVLRLDADEIVTSELRDQIAELLPRLGPEVDGVVVGRRMRFLGRTIRHGGVFPIRVLRIFRLGRGHCEDRWMDEHITVPGPTVDLTGEIIDDNLNSLTWWTAKHNAYASREVVDLLNLEYDFLPRDSIAAFGGSEASVKRWIKERLYARLPGGLRALVYFLYRYVLRAGFLDGREGLAFHVLQGFWYRFLVDAKLSEVRACMARDAVGPKEAIQRILGIDV
jgi:glycosyltransferase involved in cell wall biosynthesis